ncbi:MAG: hypothetical protein ACLFVS_06420 [Candidatus Acetothermia bacterium]
MKTQKTPARPANEVFGDDAIVYQKSYLHEFERMGLKGTLNLEEYVNNRGGNLLNSAEFFHSGRDPYSVPRYKVAGMSPRPVNFWFVKPCPTPFFENGTTT